VRTWVRQSFRNRIFVTVLLAILLPLLLCGALMMRLLIVRGEESLAGEAEEQLSALSASLSGLQEDCGAVIGQLTDSTVVRSALRRGGGNSRTLYQVLSRAAAPMRDEVRMEVYDRDGLCCYTTSGLPGGPLEVDWGILRAAGEAEGTVFRTADGGGLAAAQAVRNYSGTVLGYVVAVVEQRGFESLFGGQYTAASEVLLLDRSWRPVYYSRPAQAAQTADALRRQLLEEGTLSGEREGYRFFARSHETAGLVLVLQQPRAFTPLVMGAIYLTGALMGALCLVLGLLSAWILSRYLSQPVHQLDEAMGEVERGRLDVRLETDRSDELGRLAGRFNHMAEEYLANLDRSVQRQRELNEARLRMMQAQLNPHFLYNTLDAVKWLGMAHQAPEVAGLATDLAAILRSSISGDEVVTLEEELELVDRYVNIQTIRFGDRFTCEVDVAERYQSCLVPKLALQPLVENAILHGVADREDGYIKIRAGEEEDMLLLYVSDNGCGIPPEVLERLNSGPRQLPDGHLGLFNVDSILRLRYGEACGLSARSTPGEGSCVWLRMPLKRKEKAHAEGIDR